MNILYLNIPGSRRAGRAYATWTYMNLYSRPYVYEYRYQCVYVGAYFRLFSIMYKYIMVVNQLISIETYQYANVYCVRLFSIMYKYIMVVNQLISIETYHQTPKRRWVCVVQVVNGIGQGIL